jgi:hypothetical protein
MTAVSDVTLRHPDCVVIDTNVWRSELLLKTPVGMSFVYTLGRQHALLGLPEVVERELAKQIIEAGLDAVEQANKGSRIVSTLTGLPPWILSQKASDFEQIMNTRLSELTPILVRVPFTMAHAKAALDMVDAKVAPNTHTQQFKDSAIWQAVLQLAREYVVHFITDDRAFYLDRKDTSKGLAENLQADCEAASAKVSIFRDLGTCLNEISSRRPTIDREQVTPLITSFVVPRLQVDTTRMNCQLKELLEADVQAFSTEDPNRVALDFTVTMRLEPDVPSPNETELNRTVVAHGSCYYNQELKTIDDGFVQQARFLFRSPTGYTANLRSFPYDDPSIPFPRPLTWEWEKLTIK